MAELLDESGSVLLDEAGVPLFDESGAPIVVAGSPYRLVVGGLLGGSLVTGGLGGSAVVEPEPSTLTFLEALRTRLLAEPDLDDLAEVYLTTSPVGTVYPFLVLSELDSLPTLNTSDSYYEEVMVQYDVFSRDDYEAGRLGRAAIGALMRRGVDFLLEFAEGKEISRWLNRRRGPYEDSKPGSGGDPVFRFRFEFVHMIGRD